MGAAGGVAEPLAATGAGPHGEWEVAVIGAGPAGAVCALQLARAGRRVLLLDRRPFPRPKVCGDGLIADSLKLLARLGLLARVERQAFAAERLIAWSPRRFAVEVPGRFLTLPRERFDALLVEAAVEAGATLAVAKVDRLAPRAGGVDLQLAGRSGSSLATGVAVVATGANRALLRELLGDTGAVPARATAAALRCYVRAPHGPRDLVISLDRSVLPGYGWIFPLPGGVWNVGCGLLVADEPPQRWDLPGRFRRFAAEFPPLAHLLAQAHETTQPVGAALACGLAALPDRLPERVVAVGETVGTTFPLTGEGIGKAMESAELAAAAIDRALAGGDFAALAGFGASLREQLAPRYAGYLAAERWLARPWFLDLVALAGARSRRVRGALAGVLEETTDLARIFRWADALPPRRKGPTSRVSRPAG